MTVVKLPQADPQPKSDLERLVELAEILGSISTAVLERRGDLRTGLLSLQVQTSLWLRHIEQNDEAA